MNQKNRSLRLWLLGLLSLSALCVFMGRLAFLQLVHGREYAIKAQGDVGYGFAIAPVRGRILDRNGQELATTCQQWSLRLNALLAGKRDLNDLLRRTLLLLAQSGQQWNDTLPLTAEEPWAFTEEGTQRLAQLKSDLGLQQYATAPQVLAQLAERYGLADYSPTWQRLLAGVRRQMELEEYEDYLTFTLAEDLNEAARAAILENGLTQAGLELVESCRRVYPEGALASSILGTIGPVTPEQWAADDHALAALGYGMDEPVGQSGIEELCQERLRGSPGTLTITQNNAGQLLGSEISTPPQPGQSPVLTLDSGLQKEVNTLLAQQIESLRAAKAAGQGRECSAGAVVVLDVETGGVLAASSWPTYDLTDFAAHYRRYASAPGQPLFNRAFLGQYSPGSAFKPAVALAGLLTGTTDPQQTVSCTGNYYFYSDYQPGCLQISHSGPIAMVNALRYSCNIYFYDLGRRVGVDAVSDTAARLGLGSSTGLELPEAPGSLTTTADSNYSNGLVLQAAIGQGNNAFTPVQLATYAGTLARHGVRLRTHLIQGWYDEQTRQTLDPVEPETVEIISDDRGAFDTIEEGMLAMAQTLRVLRELPYPIAAKTGSPQRSEMLGSQHYTNTVMIAYGPVPDPKVAVALVLEYGGGGANGGPLLAGVFEACRNYGYFSA